MTEEVFIHDDFESKGEGAWPVRWYPARILPNYTSGNGNEHRTQDTVTRSGEGRNLKLLIEATNPDSLVTRVVFENMGYQPEDFSEESQTLAKEGKERNGDERHWDDKNAQRIFLTLQRFKKLTKCLGSNLTRNGDGSFDIEPLFSLELDARLGIGEDGFNKLNNLAPKGTKVK